MNCRECGVLVPQGAEYCGNCGARTVPYDSQNDESNLNKELKPWINESNEGAAKSKADTADLYDDMKTERLDPAAYNLNTLETEGDSAEPATVVAEAEKTVTKSEDDATPPDREQPRQVDNERDTVKPKKTRTEAKGAYRGESRESMFTPKGLLAKKSWMLYLLFGLSVMVSTLSLAAEYYLIELRYTGGFSVDKKLFVAAGTLFVGVLAMIVFHLFAYHGALQKHEGFYDDDLAGKCYWSLLITHYLKLSLGIITAMAMPLIIPVGMWKIALFVGLFILIVTLISVISTCRYFAAFKMFPVFNGTSLSIKFGRGYAIRFYLFVLIFLILLSVVAFIFFRQTLVDLVEIIRM